MIKIAITGNIAAGKSLVEKIIEDKGFKVYDADKIAHSILENNPKIKKEFGTTDRKKIAQVVFSEPEKLKILEAIIHPDVKNEIENIFLQDSALPYVFIAVPQLFEAKFESMFDKIIFITAEESLRKERLMNRNNFTPEEAQKRIDAQNEAGKAEKSDYVIENNAGIKELEMAVDNCLREVLNIC